MRIRQFAKLPSIKTLRIAAISSLAVGVATSISAAPAGAVTFNTGQVAVNGFSSDFFTDVGQPFFTVDFNGKASAETQGAPPGSALANLFSGSLGVTPNNAVRFDFISGSGTDFVYKLTNDLTFAYANNISYTVKGGSRFASTFNNVNSGLTFGITSDAGSFFTDRTNNDVTPALTNVFAFSDIPGAGGGGYNLVASPLAPAAVPEPFTIIGTIIGGTAAFRMKKKLSSSAKNAKN